MKVSLKFFCIGLIAAGLALSGCERPQDQEEEATAEETEQGVADEGADAEQAPAEQPDTGAAQEQAPDAQTQGDTGQQAQGQQGAAQGQQQAQQRQQQPPTTGTVTTNISGGGISNGQLRLTIQNDYSAHGELTGQREGSRFRIPLTDGSINRQNNQINLSGERGNNQATLTGTVTEGAVAGRIQGQIHGQDFSVRYTAKQ